MRLALFLALMVVRGVIIAALTACLVLSFFVLAAVGATLSDPSGGPGATAVVVGYMALVIGSLALLIWRGSRPWSWWVGAAVVALPFVLITILASRVSIQP